MTLADKKLRAQERYAKLTPELRAKMAELLERGGHYFANLYGGGEKPLRYFGPFGEENVLTGEPVKEAA